MRRGTRKTVNRVMLLVLVSAIPVLMAVGRCGLPVTIN